MTANVAAPMPKCKTCRWWDPSEAKMGGLVRICTKVPMFWDATTWDDAGNRSFTKEHADKLAFTQDASDYRADLLTRAEFGCVMHERAP